MKTNHGHGMSNCEETAHGIVAKDIRSRVNEATLALRPKGATASNEEHDAYIARLTKAIERNREHIADTHWEEMKGGKKREKKRNVLIAELEEKLDDATRNKLNDQIHAGTMSGAVKQHMMDLKQLRTAAAADPKKAPILRQGIAHYEDLLKKAGGDPQHPDTLPVLHRMNIKTRA